MSVNPQQYPEPAEPVRAQHIGAETVIVLDATLALVASVTEADAWHVIDHGVCTCPAYRFRQTCRHLAVAATATQLAFPPPDDTAAEALFTKLDQHHRARS